MGNIMPEIAKDPFPAYVPELPGRAPEDFEWIRPGKIPWYRKPGAFPPPKVWCDAGDHDLPDPMDAERDHGWGSIVLCRRCKKDFFLRLYEFSDGGASPYWTRNTFWGRLGC